MLGGVGEVADFAAVGADGPAEDAKEGYSGVDCFDDEEMAEDLGMDEHDRHLHYPEEEKAQEVSGGDTSACRQVVGDVSVAIAKDTAHENRCDATAVVSLDREVDDGDDGSDKDVQTGPSYTCCGANIDWEAYKVLDGTSTVQNDQDREDYRSDDSGDDAMPPKQSDGYK